MQPQLAEDSIRNFEQAKSDRATFESHYQSVCDMVMPTRSFTVQMTPGQERNNRIFNSTAPDAADTLSAALDGLLTNASIRWMALTLEEFDESEDEEAAAWLYHVTSLVLGYMASPISGWPLASHEIYLDLVGFGIGVMQANENASTGAMRFKARALANHYVCENDDGELDEVYRYFEPRARELKSLFPDGKFSEQTLKMIEDPKRCNERVPMVHCIYRRYDYDTSRSDKMNKPWASRYIELKAKKIVVEGGFDRLPYLIPRWAKAADEAYGRSPAMNCLATIRVVNAKEKTMLKAAEKAVDPPMNVWATGLEGPLRTAPGSINYVKAGSSPPTPAYTGVNIAVGVEEIKRDEYKIERAFYLDALKLPEIDRMTREEVITRRQQGLLRASPVLSRLYTELIGPAVTLVFNWLKRTGQLPPPPQSIAGRKLSIQYVSPMALSQRASEADNFTAAMATAAPLESVAPGVIGQNVDANASVRTIFAMHNVDPRFLRPKREVAQLQKSQQEDQVLAQTVALAGTGAGAIRQGAAAVKDLSAASPTV